MVRGSQEVCQREGGCNCAGRGCFFTEGGGEGGVACRAKRVRAEKSERAFITGTL